MTVTAARPDAAKSRVLPTARCCSKSAAPQVDAQHGLGRREPLEFLAVGCGLVRSRDCP